MPAIRLFKTVSSVRKYTHSKRAERLTVGLVPTLGSLHEGHASLIKRAKRECDVVIVSVFVNRYQFRPKGFREYPRDLKTDMALAEAAGADGVFAPSEKEMYPEGQSMEVAIPPMFEKLKEQRLGWHFKAVLVVVAKLFNIVSPHRAYFGQKDPHQLALIEAMTRGLNMDLKIIGCPTVRHRNGLAVSSRNKLLSVKELAAAPVIYRAVKSVADDAKSGKPTASLLKKAASIIATEPLARLDHIELLDSDTLEPYHKGSRRGFCFATVWIGDKRLTDNIRFSSPTKKS